MHNRKLKNPISLILLYEYRRYCVLYTCAWLFAIYLFNIGQIYTHHVKTARFEYFIFVLQLSFMINRHIPRYNINE